ncbi:MAG: hypothetical protein C4320_02030 [Armatimonadota bacterium]
MRPRIRPFLIPLMALATVAFAQKAVQTATVADLIKDGAKFDKKHVRVTGTVQKLEEKQTRTKKDYFKFELVDAGNTINVYGFGKVEGLRDGVKVEATGRFAVSKKMRNFEVKNQLDVSAPRPRRKAGEPAPTEPVPVGKPGIEILK